MTTSDRARDAVALVTAVGKHDNDAVLALLAGIEVRHLLCITFDLAHAMWALACWIAEKNSEDPQELWERVCAPMAAGMGTDA